MESVHVLRVRVRSVQAPGGEFSPHLFVTMQRGRSVRPLPLAEWEVWAAVATEVEALAVGKQKATAVLQKRYPDAEIVFQ